MSFNESICGTDGSGTNIKIGVRNNEILRLEPKTNMYVNKYWMSDNARLDFKWVNDNRVVHPMIDSKEVEWKEAFKAVSLSFKQHKQDEIMILTSGKSTNEDAFIIRKFANKYGIKNLYLLPHIDESVADDMLNTKERVPNSTGAKELGIDMHKDVTDKLKSGKIKVLFLIEEDLAQNTHLFEAISKVETLIVSAYNQNKLTDKADIVLATSTFAEIEGTFTNVNKRVQHFEPALVTKENVSRMGMKMSRLDKMGAPNDRWTQHDQRNCKQTWKILQSIANLDGANWHYKHSEEIFDEIAQSVASFKSMNYVKLDEHQGLKLGAGDKPDTIVHNYQSHVMKPN